MLTKSVPSTQGFQLIKLIWLFCGEERSAERSVVQGLMLVSMHEGTSGQQPE